MKEHESLCLLSCIAIVSWSFGVVNAAISEVSSVTPQCGSINGGTRVTIYGKNFARNFFNFGDGNEDVGSKVRLSALKSYECEIHPDGSHETQIMCYTLPMPAGEYDVKVSVDGEDVAADKYCDDEDDCKFTASEDCTPTITNISPVSGMPGSFLEIKGDIITTKYGSNEPDELENIILRVYFGGQKCELRDMENDGLYGVALDDNIGWMKCLTEGTYIGNNEVSFMVSNEYGRSKPDGITKHVHRNGIGMYQTYTEISGLSQNEGSTSGGTRITVNGQHFDETVTSAVIMVGDEECTMDETVADAQMICSTPADASSGISHFTGGRGFYAYVVNGSSDASSINTNTAEAQHIDSSSWSAVDWPQHAVLMMGYFIPVYSGSYKFCLKAASTATLYMSADHDPTNKESVISGSGSSCSGRESSIYTLTKDSKYYMETHYSSDESNSYVSVVAHLMETELSEEDTGMAEHEIQDMKFTSTVTKEIQGIEISTSGSASSTTADVQEVTISGNPDAYFAIGLDGIFTAPILLSSVVSGDDIKAELTELPNIDFEIVVEVQTKGLATVLEITSDSSTGPISLYSAKVVGGSANDLKFSFDRTTEGTPSLETFTLTMDGIPTSPIPVGASNNEVKSALEALFGVRCHPKLSSGKIFDFESDEDWMTGRVSDDEPFCGRYSAKNPRYIYNKGKADDAVGIRIASTTSRFMCLAYKGLAEVSSVRVGYVYTGTDKQEGKGTISFNVDNNNPEGWSYWCEDIFALIDVKVTGTGIVVNYAQAFRKNSEEDLFIDHVLFNRERPLDEALMDGVLNMRLPQVQPNDYFVDTISVSSTGSPPTAYEISLSPHHCGYNLPLFGVAAASKSGSTYTIKNGGTVKVKVTQVQTASPPIEGTYKITFKDASSPSPIPVTLELDADNVVANLNAMNVGFSEVTESGTCSEFTYRVKMISQTGDQPQMEIDDSKITGTDAQGTVETIRHGGLWFDPIMGDLLRTHHTTPQVIAFINDVPTKCRDTSSCSFQWDPSFTPSVSGISPDSGSHGDTVQITGSGFDAVTLENNKVIIGTTACNVTAASTTRIDCTINNGPTGPASVNVIIAAKGLAAGSVSFTYVTGTDAFAPAPGSVQGGSLLTLNGFGFTSDAVVSLDGNKCTKTVSSESQIQCKTPAAASTSTTQTVNVIITQVGSSVTAGQFTYNPSLTYTPVISSISATTSNVWGGDTITITGQGFGGAEMPVSLGGEAMTVTSYGDTQIVAELPALSHGSYQLLVDVENKGYADLRTNGISDIDYVFKVTSMTPTLGSMYGGTDVLITGEGFTTNTSVIDVTFGPHVCDIQSVTSASIQCRIADTGINHDIAATGTHKNYGVGYAWDKDPHTVSVGDYVTWHWETPFYVSDIFYAVHQTETASDVTNMPDGFTSGARNRKGSFTHRFTVPGTYYYWTGYMDTAEVIFFRGTVNVVELESHSKALSVTMMGHDALYDTAGTEVTDSTSCTPVEDELAGCSDSASLTAEAGKFNFDFKKCYSPIVNSISHTNGTFSTEITMAGEGFGDATCQNEVSFSGASCNTIRSSASSVGFKVSAVDSPPIGVMHEFSVRVANLGYALVTVQGESNRLFGLLPEVNQITPFEGSKVGGTKLTISGAGFEGTEDDMYIDLMHMSCEVESANYTTIICETNCGTTPSSCFTGVMTATVTVGVILADCEDPLCNFLSLESKTATVSSISPNSVTSASTSLTITGTGFGTSASDVKVMIGGESCVVSGSVTDTQITCTVGRLPVGDNDVDVYIANNGKAATTEDVTSVKSASISVPSASSTNGGAVLVITGNGFVENDTTVDIDGDDCPVVSVDFDEVKCTLPAKAAASQNVVVTSNGVTYDTLTLTYSTAATPNVVSTSPSGGQSGDSITISGTGFTSPAGSSPTVMIGDAACTVTGSTSTSITCTLGVQHTGAFDIEVFVEQAGYSNDDATFTYELGTFTINPALGSTNGGQLLTLTGSGFLENDTSVTICSQQCTEVSLAAGEYVCKTPAGSAGACDVVATAGSVSKTKAGAYTYDASLVSTVTSVNPARGGTGGGTVITIAGTNFGSNPSDISVEINGATCTVENVIDTQIKCRAGSSTSSDALVEVQRNGWGVAQQISAGFEYIDMWSSPYTWGGASPPEEGDFVIIPAGQKILLDTDTEIMKMLLIQGGQVIFDEANVELQAENILIIDGGLLQAGTSETPFPQGSKAIITLHGFLRSKELPIYGTKTLAVREGTLNLYGYPTIRTWTRLGSTADAGDNTITLELAVDWNVGDQIVIATTGDRHSQKESEVHVIQAISGNGLTITLEEPLAYEHIGYSGTFGSTTVEFRAEVGLLTHNVVVQGNRNTNFDTEIEACPAGFNTGEFATQTCFQGRFGEELGSDQFGAQVMVHQAVKDTQVAQAHLEYVEFTRVGQAFRMGRYPVHFHLNGNMDQSFVRGCSIHTSFNRAVNIHGTHNTMVEHNVIYNTMGGSFFLEDGDETGNTFQYNLAVFVRSSTSLRNDDITPAAFWATNPNNTISHNAAAGGTHFGTWYRMHTHPEGPGFDANICPQSVPLAEYKNNTAHSLGWFGLWIFEQYIPRVDGSCSGSADHQVAQFYSLTAWNCEKGAEAVDGGALQFREFVLVNNDFAGYEGKKVVGSPPLFDSANGPGVFDSVIVSHYSTLRGKPTHGGIVQPYLDGFLVENTEFYNFDQAGKSAMRWTRIDGTCSLYCGAFRTEVSGLTFSSSPNKIFYGWESEGVIYDRDGSLTGNVGHSVTACTNSLDHSACTEDSGMSTGIGGCICTDSIKLIRFSFNNPLPESLLYKDAVFVTEHGKSNSPWAEKRITHGHGWAMVLMANNYYNFSFENADHITNISYDSTFSSFSTGDFVVFTQFADQKPDLFMLDGATALNASDTMLSGTDVSHGDWFYSVPDLSLTYTVKRAARKKRAAVISSTKFNIDARAIRCYYRGCTPPPDPMEVMDEPTHKELWSDPATWVNLTHDGLEPGPNDDLTIPKDKWIIVDQEIPVLGKVKIEGGLQFLNNDSMNILLEADYLFITGRFIMGWSAEDPFRGQAVIRLRGHHKTPVYPTTDGPSLGAKFIAVYGGLQLHGVDRGLTKSRLAATVSAGGNTITVKDNVGWVVNDEIVITTSDYRPTHTETFKISAISGNTITLNDTLAYRHVSHSETINGHDLELSAFVGLLTRNIRIEGQDYADLFEESFGARVIIGQTFDHLGTHSGFAQISNVEFYHTGQEGFSENYDARFSVTFSDVTSTEGEVRYSYVRKNAFHHGFNAAVGVFGVDNLEIDDNVIHNTVGHAIRTESVGTKITNNLVTLNLWPGSYQDRVEALNMDYDGAVEAILAADLVLVNNSVYGSERSAYRLAGQACSTASSDLWSNNIGASSMIGMILFPADAPADGSCTRYSGFTMWKNVDYGLYYNNDPSAELKNNILVENGVGIMPLINGPAALSHAYADKSVIIEDNIFVGKTSSFSESDDGIVTSDPNIALSGMARGQAGTKMCGKIGMVMGTFSSKGNNAPVKPFAGIMSYQAIKGYTDVTGNTFANFGSCTGGRDVALTTNGKNDDACFPVFVSGSTLVNVDEGSRLLYHRPNVGKINSADCVDMDCDGLKKCLIRDSEGAFLGSPGTVLPDSAYQWDGDRRHGLGDYRIPAVMLAAPNGQKIDVDSYAPNKGVFKTDNCTWMSDWQAYKCNDDYDFRILNIESMDADTETRRLSPIAVYHPEGYVDLVNGPQDHGWCSGYTCRLRLSTFQAIVALDEPFDLFLSSTNPKHMRYMMLKTEADECVRLGMYYLSSNRLEVSVDGTVILPTNGYIDANGGFRLKLQNTNHQYMPDARNKSNGQNYISRAESMIFWVQCGTSVIDVVQTEVLIMSFTLPAMTNEDFFGEQIVRNLAAFLDMDPNKVRIVNIVEDTSSSGRKKRQTGTTIFYVEIGDTPGTTNTVDYTTVAKTLCNQAHLYSFDDVINATVLYTAIQEPGSPGASSGVMVTLQKTGQLVMDTVPVGDVQEGQELSVQPKLKVTDSNGDVVPYLGSISSPWEVEVSIKSGGSAGSQLSGNTSVTFVDGWANFTNLAISNKGDDYILEFNIMSPPEAANYSIEALAVTVLGRNIGPKAVMKTSNRLTGLPIQMEVLLYDKDTDLDITNIEWANHTWTATASIYDSVFYSGTLGGMTTVDFDPSTGKATFINLQLDAPGKCPILVTITSDPADYEVQMVAHVDVMTTAQKNMIVAEMHTLELKFPIEYDSDRADYWTAQVRNYYSDKSDLRITGDGHRKGSFVVSLNVQGTADGYNDTLNTMCYEISNGTTFTFDGTTVAMSGYLTVDGVSYYGTSCGPTTEDDDDELLETVYIAVIAVLALIIIILVCIMLAYKFYFHPMAKTYDSQNAQYLGNSKKGDYLPDCLERDGTFTSLKNRPFSPAVPPTGTMISSRSFVLDIQTPGRPANIEVPEPEIPGTPTRLQSPTSIRTITPQPTPTFDRAANAQRLLEKLSLARPEVDKPPTPEMRLPRPMEQRPSVSQPEWNF